MKDPVPAKEKPAARPARSAAVTEVRVLARFYRRMKLQRVFPLVVELQGGGAGMAPVFIHPFIPGATVTPSELTLDPATPGGKATFYVTPLAKGQLRDARLDVFHQGRLIQEIPVRMRSVTQCLTWFLAALTILVPAFLLYSTKYHPMQGMILVTRPVPAGVAPEEEPAKKEEQPEPIPGNVEKLEQLPAKEKSEGGDAAAKPQEPKTQPKKAKKGKANAGQPPETTPPPGGAVPAFGEPRHRTIPSPAFPGDLLEKEINRNVPDVPAKITLPWSDESVEVPFAVSRHVAWGIGALYTNVCELSRTDFLSFWVGVGLLGLTCISAVLHRPARTRKRGKPLVLAGG